MAKEVSLSFAFSAVYVNEAVERRIARSAEEQLGRDLRGIPAYSDRLEIDRESTALGSTVSTFPDDEAGFVRLNLRTSSNTFCPATYPSENLSSLS